MPSFSQRASRQRSSINYDELAGKRNGAPQSYNLITGKIDGKGANEPIKMQLPRIPINSPQPAPWERDQIKYTARASSKQVMTPRATFDRTDPTHPV